MNRSDVAKLIARIEDFYDLTFEKARVDRFVRTLADYDATMVNRAASDWFEAERFPPRPADLIRTARSPPESRDRTAGGERDPWCPFGKFTNDLGEECVQFPDGPSGCWSKPVSLLADYDWRIIASLLQDDSRTPQESTP